MSAQFSGSTIPDLTSMAFARVDQLPDPLLPDPLCLLTEAKIHLADKPMDSGDEAAWWMLGDIQQCFISGKLRECRHCGQMEGLHSAYGSYCRYQPSGATPHLSYRFEAKR